MKAAAAPTAPAALDAAAAQRKRDTTRIHVLRALLRITEDEYRDLVGNLYDGKRSSTDLTPAQRSALVQHLEGLARRQALPAARKRVPLTPRQAKMFSLWQQLADKALVRDRRMSALQSWIRRQTGLDDKAWPTTAQEDTVIEALKKWVKRGAEPTGAPSAALKTNAAPPAARPVPTAAEAGHG